MKVYTGMEQVCM